VTPGNLVVTITVNDPGDPGQGSWTRFEASDVDLQIHPIDYEVCLKATGIAALQIDPNWLASANAPAS